MATIRSAKARLMNYSKRGGPFSDEIRSPRTVTAYFIASTRSTNFLSVDYHAEANASNDSDDDTLNFSWGC